MRVLAVEVLPVGRVPAMLRGILRVLPMQGVAVGVLPMRRSVVGILPMRGAVGQGARPMGRVGVFAVRMCHRSNPLRRMSCAK